MVTDLTMWNVHAQRPYTWDCSTSFESIFIRQSVTGTNKPTSVQLSWYAFIITSDTFFVYRSRGRLASYDFSFVQIGSLRHFSPHSAEWHVPSNSNWANNTNVYYVSCQFSVDAYQWHYNSLVSYIPFSLVHLIVSLFRLFGRAHTRRVRECGFLCSPLDPLACATLWSVHFDVLSPYKWNIYSESIMSHQPACGAVVVVVVID